MTCHFYNSEDFVKWLKEQEPRSLFCTVYSDIYDSCSNTLMELAEKLEKPSHRAIVIKQKPDVMSIVRGDDYNRLEGTDWVDHIYQEAKKEVDQQIDSEGITTNQENYWLVVIPERPIKAQGRDFGIPLHFWYELWHRFYKDLPNELAFYNEENNKKIFYHAIVGDINYINSWVHRDDIYTTEAHLNDYEASLSFPVLIGLNNEAMQPVKVSPLVEILKDKNKYRMEQEVAWIRALLVKKHFASRPLTGTAKIGRVQVDRKGDTLLVEFWKERKFQSSYWCKFGSPKKLSNEHQKTIALRAGIPPIQRFLSHTEFTLERDSMLADYLGLLVSEPLALQARLTEVDTLESLYKSLYDRKTKPDDKNRLLNSLKLAFEQLNDFFNDLHQAHWQNVGDLTARQGYRGTKYDILLTSARFSYRSGKPLILDNQGGNYEIEFIVPHDSKPDDSQPILSDSERANVAIHLKRQNNSISQNGQSTQITDRLLLYWEKEDWRWQMWLDGLREGTRVKLEVPQKGKEAEAGYRIAGHLTNFRRAIRGIQDTERRNKLLGRWDNFQLDKLLDVKISEITSAGSKTIELSGTCRVLLDSELLLTYDIYPRFLHGDLHPRNVLVLREGDEIQLKIIDLAHAVVDEDAPYPAPMAFDFAVMEVDAKARMLLDAHFHDFLTPQGFDDTALLICLDKQEQTAWGWCQTNLDNCFHWSENNSQSPLSLPIDLLRQELQQQEQESQQQEQESQQQEQESQQQGSAFVINWRSLCLDRLQRISQERFHSEAEERQGDIRGSGWTPARSYAQALLLASLGFLKFLNPDNAKEASQGLACVIGAIRALEVLNSPGSQ